MKTIERMDSTIVIRFGGSDYRKCYNYLSQRRKYYWNAKIKAYTTYYNYATWQELLTIGFVPVASGLDAAVPAAPSSTVQTLAPLITSKPWVTETSLPYQREALEYSLSRPRALLNLPPGAGKTHVATMYAQNILPILKKKLLIVTPAFLKINFQRELLKWAALPSTILGGTHPYPIKDLSDVLIINYDVLDAWMPELMGKIDGIIMDESHYIKYKSAKRARAVLKLQTHAKSLLMLTGTPMDNYATSGYLQFYMARKDLFPSELRFKERYCEFGGNGRGGVEIVGAKNSAELHGLLQSFMFTRTREEILPDLPKVQRQMLYLEGSQSYRNEELEVWNLINSGILQGVEKANRLGALSRSAYVLKRDSLIEYIDNRLETSKDVIIVGVWHRAVLEDLQAYYQCKYINGQISNKQAVVDAFEASDDRILLVQTKSGVGFSILRANVVIHAEYPTNDAELDQLESRILRLTSTHDHVQYVYPVVVDSIEETQIDRIVRKSKSSTEIIHQKSGHILDSAQVITE